MAKRELTDPRVQGPQVDPLDKMIAIAARIAEREGLLLEEADSTATLGDVVADRELEGVEQDRRSA